MSAPCTWAPTRSPVVSVMMWRLRPLTFLPASYPRGPPLSVVLTVLEERDTCFNTAPLSQLFQRDSSISHRFKIILMLVRFLLYRCRSCRPPPEQAGIEAVELNKRLESLQSPRRCAGRTF